MTADALPGLYTLTLLGSTFVLSALWAAVLLVLVRLREREREGAGEARGAPGRPAPGGPTDVATRAGRAPARLGVELAWAVIPALIVLSVVVPALQSGWSGAGGAGADDGERTAEVAPGR